MDEMITLGNRLSQVAFVMLYSLLVSSARAQTAPPLGTWVSITNTVLFPVIPFDAKSESAPNGQPELWSPQSLFAFSGGDLYKWYGVWGFFVWGGGHAATADNSLYWNPLDGSGPKRLMGPYLAPDKFYNYHVPLETYRDVSRNQNGLPKPTEANPGSPKSRHTYSSLLGIEVKGKPHVFCYGGSLCVGSGSGTKAVRLFDLSQSYAQAMARLDMGWRLGTAAPSGSVASSSGWDPVQKRVVVRGAHSLGVYYPDTDRTTAAATTPRPWPRTLPAEKCTCSATASRRGSISTRWH